MGSSVPSRGKREPSNFWFQTVAANLSFSFFVLLSCPSPLPPPFVSYRKLGQESYLALLKSIRANIQMGQNSEIFTCRLLTTLHCTNAAFSLPPAFLFLLCTLSYMLSTSARWVTGCCIPRQTMGSGVLPLLLTTSNGLW